MYCLPAKSLQTCLTLCNSMDCSPLSSSVHEIFQARILAWVAISFSEDFPPTKGLNLGLLHCRQVLYQLSHEGNQKENYKQLQIEVYLQ